MRNRTDSVRERCMTSTIPHFLAVVLIVAFSIGTAGVAEAEECKWFGKRPLCDGECPAGWRLKNFSGDGCIGTWGVSGTRALCCREEAKAPCGPTQYGTEGCPYPPFGNAPGSGSPPPAGPTADSITENQKQKDSTPTPAGPKADDFGGPILQRPSDAMKSDILKKPEEANPCGPGMFKGGDGQCYPKLN